jgi:hypothetical protein
MTLVKTQKKYHAISERGTPDKGTAEQTQTLHPVEGVEATAAMVKRQGGEQKQVRVEEVGAEGTAGALL